MKKLLNLASILFALTATNANAQIANVSQREFVSNSEYSAKATANDRVIGKFEKSFPNANGENWLKTKNGFAVRFSSNNINELVFLTKRGGVLSSIKYFSEKDIPSDVKEMVKYVYPTYTIKSGREIQACNKTAYLVTIEDADSWKTVRVVDGEMDVYEAYVKY
ncbi:MAG: hypothetical protein ACXVLT_05515 [Flavisolibacter sp.]